MTFQRRPTGALASLRLAILGAILLLTLIAPPLARNAAAASTITVNSAGDVNSRDFVMTLREAILLANGDLPLGDLTEEECGQVSVGIWARQKASTGVSGILPDPRCTTLAFPVTPPGAASADTIVFSTALFVDIHPNHINLNGALNSLDGGSDSIVADGDAVNGASNVTINGGGNHPCISFHSDNNSVRGLSFVGCDYGVTVTGANSNTIGGTDPSDRNTFSDSGVSAVLVWAGSQGTLIEGNTFVDNPVGIDIGGQSTTANIVAGNYIGFDPLNPASPGNGTGIEIDAAPGNVIGGTNTGIAGNGAHAGNVISGNDIGVELTGATAQDNVVAGNYIGTNIDGDAALPNLVGIDITNGAANNMIGGDTPGERNVISGNVRRGVGLFGQAATGNMVLGNYIGTTADGEGALGNVANGGVELGEAGPNLIQNNLISANGSDASGGNPAGIFMTTGTSGVEIYENRIGVSASGDPLPNAFNGIYLRGASGTVIGDVNGGGNVIAYNHTWGVHIAGSGFDSTSNTIRGNSIHSNGGPGIDNEDGGNEELAPPVITGFGSVSGTACDGCTVDVYSDDENEGRIHEGSTTADGDGDWALAGQFFGPNVTATATDGDGNTSEFSEPALVPDPATPTPTPSPSPTPTPTASPSPTATASGAAPTERDLVWGDNQCDGLANPVDSLITLRFDAGLSTNLNGCPPLGADVEVLNVSAAGLGDGDGDPQTWGDVDCDGAIIPVDSLKILRFDASLSVSQEAGCPPPGAGVTVQYFD